MLLDKCNMHLCCECGTIQAMYERYSEDVPPMSQALAVIAILLLITGVFAFGPRRDPSKVVAGIPCSVLSETEIGAIIGTPMRLVPTTGTTCEYVATTSGMEHAVFITVHRNGSNKRVFAIAVVGPEGDRAAQRERARLAAMIRPRAVAAR